MFGNNREKEPMSPTSINTPQGHQGQKSSSSRGQDTITAYLGPDTSVEGTLRFEHSVLIEGKFKGEIESDGSLVIGEGAEVDAEIKSRIINIKGTVRGKIVASERVQIQGNGVVLGDITTPSISMDESVVFEGSCSMGRAANRRTSDGKQQQNQGQHDKNKKKDTDKIVDAVESVR